MKRKLKLNLSIDYNKLMKENKVKIVESCYTSDEEDRIIKDVINKISNVCKCVKIEMCIEDFEKWKSEGYNRSNKMGASCSKIWEFLK